MPVETLIEDPRWAAVDLSGQADTATTATLRHLGFDPGDYEVSLLGCDDARIAVLNAEFREKPAATNVLSWPSEERAADVPGEVPERPVPFLPDEPIELGDIAIAYDTCAGEATAAGKPLAAHTTHLVAHAVLHLLGYDHENDADAALMERTEVEILASLGIENPY